MPPVFEKHLSMFYSAALDGFLYYVFEMGTVKTQNTNVMHDLYIFAYRVTGR